MNFIGNKFKMMQVNVDKIDDLITNMDQENDRLAKDVKFFEEDLRELENL